MNAVSEEKRLGLRFFAVIMAYAIASAALLRFGTAFSDEGILYQWGRRILAGELPYTDFFLQMAPGTFYIQAALMKVFGMSIMAGRIFKQFEGLLAGLLVYAIVVRAFGNRRAGLIAMAVSFAWSGALHIRYHWYTMDAGIMILIGVYFFVRFVQSEGMAMIFLSGLGFGASVLFKQNMGIFAALTGACLLMVYGLREKKNLLLKWLPVFSISALAPVALYLAYYAASGGDLNALYLQTLAYPQKVYGYQSPLETVVYPLKVFLLLHKQDAGYYYIIAVLLVSAACFSAKRSPRPLAAAGAALFLGTALYWPGVFARFSVWMLNFLLFIAAISASAYAFFKNGADKRAFLRFGLSVFALSNLYGGIMAGGGLGRFVETMTGSFYVYGVLVDLIENDGKALWDRAVSFSGRLAVNAGAAAYSALALMMVVGNVSFAPGLDVPLYRMGRTMTVEGAKGIRGEQAYVAETEEVVNYAKYVTSGSGCCKKKLFVFPLNCMLYPLVGAENPVSFDTFQSIPFVAEFIPDLMAQLEWTRPDVVVMQKRANQTTGPLEDEKVWVHGEVVGAVRGFVERNYVKTYETPLYYEVYLRVSQVPCSGGQGPCGTKCKK